MVGCHADIDSEREKESVCVKGGGGGYGGGRGGGEEGGAPGALAVRQFRMSSVVPRTHTLHLSVLL